MKKKIFAVSDIHGHATLLREALEEAGFDSLNKEHLLVVIGDCFDRGTENKAVLSFLSSIKNKILVKGNHEDMLVSAIERGYLSSVDFYNGTDITLLQFLGQLNVDAYGEITGGFSVCDRLLEFANSMRDYFVTENYVFTHAWLPLEYRDDRSVIKENWKYITASEWKRTRFIEWNKIYSKESILKDKTIVCGHRSTSYAYKFDESRHSKDYSPFVSKGIAAIDGCTLTSKKVNVLVIEDEVPEPQTFSMSLRDDMFALVSSGDKIIEMRMLDEKRSLISIGDIIEFTAESDENKKITVTVTGLYSYPDFYSLTKDFSPLSLGFYENTPQEIASILEEIYSEKKNKYKPLAIRISR